MIVLIFIAVLFLLIAVRGFTEEKQKIQKWETEFKVNYGNKNSRQWKSTEIEKIAHYSRYRKTKDTVDDQTWNDLGMDKIFQDMAYTGSSLGDDYLYYILRNPVMSEECLNRREKKIVLLKEQEELRIRLQILYAQIGRMKEYSFADYINFLMLEKKKSNGKHYLTDIMILLSLGIMIYHVGAGGILFFGLILYNIVTYFKHKARLEPYLASMRYLLKNLEYAKKLIPLLPEEWEYERTTLTRVLALMKKVQKNSYLVMSPGRMSGGGAELVLDYLRMCFHIDIIKYNTMLSQIRCSEKEIWKLYEIMGETDACIAIGEYRTYLPYVCVPEFHDKKEVFMKRGYHPQIENAVANSLDMKKNVLLTGSNASGKSTFLRTMGINVLLAQTIHTCAAEMFILPFCRLYTSMSLKDSLSLKESYYMAEIKAIKRILDAANEGEMVVCMVDEVLRGTNTIERIAASTQILKGMAGKDIICMAATHDVELTNTLAQYYDNYHFEESLEQSDVTFSYRLQAGRAESCNAIGLLEHLGYDKGMITNARKMIKDFKEQGEWKCV